MHSKGGGNPVDPVVKKNDGEKRSHDDLTNYPVDADFPSIDGILHRSPSILKQPSVAAQWFLTTFVAYLVHSTRFYKANPSRLRKEVLSGVTVAVMQVPESVAFSFVAGVPPISGLYATFFLGFITAAVGGKPGMISGAAGALAVVAVDVMSEDGPLSDLTKDQRFEVLMMTMIFCGIFQLLAAAFNLAVLVKLIPQSAMLGFMNGLAIIIFTAQFAAFKRCPLAPDNFQECTSKQQEWMTLDDGNTWWLLFLVFATMFVMHFFPKIPKIGRMIPGSMAGLVVATLFEHFVIRNIDAKTRTVGETAPLSGKLPIGHIPDVEWTGPVPGVIISYGISLGAIGLIESVMTLQAVDEITETPPSVIRSAQECYAQGLANFICGFFGAMGGDAMIGQSTINVINGARGRISGMVAGIGMLIFIVAASTVIELVPIGGLTGVLFMVVVHTFNWGTFRTLFVVPKMDALVVIVVTVLAVVTNLAVAVALGVGLLSCSYAWKVSKRTYVSVATVVLPSPVVEQVIAASEPFEDPLAPVIEKHTPQCIQNIRKRNTKPEDAKQVSNATGNFNQQTPQEASASEPGPSDAVHDVTIDISAGKVEEAEHPAPVLDEEVVHEHEAQRLEAKHAGKNVVELQPVLAKGEVRSRVYFIRGAVFFAGMSDFASHFDPAGDAALGCSVIICDVHEAKLEDFSSIAGLQRLSGRYAKHNVRFIVVGLRKGCRVFMNKAAHLAQGVSVSPAQRSAGYMDAVMPHRQLSVRRSSEDLVDHLETVYETGAGAEAGSSNEDSSSSSAPVAQV